jgi:hypothetical protein
MNRQTEMTMLTRTAGRAASRSPPGARCTNRPPATRRARSSPEVQFRTYARILGRRLAIPSERPVCQAQGIVQQPVKMYWE